MNRSTKKRLFAMLLTLALAVGELCTGGATVHAATLDDEDIISSDIISDDAVFVTDTEGSYDTVTAAEDIEDMTDEDGDVLSDVPETYDAEVSRLFQDDSVFSLDKEPSEDVGDETPDKSGDAESLEGYEDMAEDEGEAPQEEILDDTGYTPDGADECEFYVGSSILKKGANNTDAMKAAKVYYAGTYWNVIGYDGTVGAAAKSDAITLLLNKPNSSIQFGNDITYFNSDLRNFIDNWYESTFSDLEKRAVRGRTLEVDTYKSVRPYCNGVAGQKVTDAKLWPLSTAEADKLIDTNVHGNWWLRSPGMNEKLVAIVHSETVLPDGFKSFLYNNPNNTRLSHLVRPAFWLSISSVIMTKKTDSNLYKPVIKDDNLFINVPSSEKITITDPVTGNVKVPYTVGGDDSGLADSVSVMILDKEYKEGNSNNASVLYYNKLKAGSTFSTTGTGDFTLPHDLDPNDWGSAYRVYLLAEGKLGSERAGIASIPLEIKKSDLKYQLVNYGLYIGTHAVSSVNYKDVLGNGKISYDPLNKRLTLNNVTNVGLFGNAEEINGKEFAIYSDVDNLTITGTADLSGADYCIYSSKKLTFDNAEFTLDADYTAIYANNIIINGGSQVITKSRKQYCVYANGITINDGELKAETEAAADEAAIKVGTSMTVNGGIVKTAVNGMSCSGIDTPSLFVYGGSLDIESEGSGCTGILIGSEMIVRGGKVKVWVDDDDIQADAVYSKTGKVKINGGYVDLYADHYALYAGGGISIDSSMAITLPARHTSGKLSTDNKTIVDPATDKKALWVRIESDVLNYTVRFDLNGKTGTSPATQSLPKGYKVVKPADPEIKGYKLEGWYTEPKCYYAWNFNTDTVTKDVTLYAKWTPITYTVRYDKNKPSSTSGEVEGTMPDQILTYDKEEKLRALDYTLAGYTFKEYNTKAEGSGTSYYTGQFTYVKNLTTIDDAVVTLYTQWEPNKYSVMYWGNKPADATGTVTGFMTNSFHTFDTTGNLTSNSYSLDGYTFIGWSQFPGESSVEFSDGQSVKNIGGYSYNGEVMDLYAQWKQNGMNYVSFNLNGHGSVTPPGQTIDTGGKVSRPPLDPEETGYLFKGWYTEPACINEYDFSLPVTSDFTLYAKWVYEEYTADFNLNGHGAPIVSQTIPKGGTVTRPADPTEAGYTFDGWYTDSDCPDEAKYVFASKVIEDFTLYAKWVKPGKYTVTFDMNGHGDPIVSQSINEGGTVIKPTDPAAAGFTFKGWYLDPECSVPYDFNSKLYSDVILYAKWVKNGDTVYTVNFNMNGYGKSVPTQAVGKGKKPVQPSDPVDETNTMVFAGWFADSAFLSDFNFDKSITCNTTVYAKWEAIDPNGFFAYFDIKNDTLAYNSGSGRFEHIYTGSKITPKVIVEDCGGRILKDEIDYSIKYNNNQNVDKKGKPATVTITGKGRYKNSKNLLFYILPKSLGSGLDEKPASGIYMYDIILTSGSKAAPVIYYRGYKLASKDFELKSKTGNIKFTDADLETDRKLSIYGKGNFSGCIFEAPVTIVSKDDMKTKTINVSLSGVNCVYNGKPQKLTEGQLVVRDGNKNILAADKYEVVYTDNINAGTAKVTVSGKNGYTGTAMKTFKISSDKNISNMAATPIIGNVYFSPEGLGPELNVTATRDGVTKTLKEGKDYKVSYSNNKKVTDKAKYTVSFMGNYQGQKSICGTYAIKAAAFDISHLKVCASDLIYKNPGKYLSVPYVMYDGVLLNKNDYTVIYKVGSKDITNAKYTLTGASASVDVILKGKGNYADTDVKITGCYSIRTEPAGAIDLSKAKITMKNNINKKIPDQEYTGKELTPEFDIYVKSGNTWKKAEDASLVLGTDYKVTYINNKEKGNATILVDAISTSTRCFKNKTEKFKINPRNLVGLRQLLKL